MNNRKSISTLFTALALTVIVSFSLLQAAQAQGMMRTPAERARALKDSLALSDEQIAKATKIFEAQHKEMMDMMGAFQGNRDTMRKAMQGMMAKTDKQIEALLTKDQLKKYQELKKQLRQMRPRMRQRRQEG